MNTAHDKFGVLLLTRNAEQHLQRCLGPVFDSPLRPKVLVIDTTSEDQTREMALRMGAQVMMIKPHEFNHGATRERGRKLLGTEIVIMLTQDAYPVDPGMLGLLVKPLLAGEAAVSYARQIPHRGAGLIESFQREFNYPPASQIRSLADSKNYNVYTFFCSNSCAAWSNAALDQVGGFPAILSNEDYVTVARLLSRDYRIAYVAEAQVYHSHTYTLRQEFQRYFDIGYVRNEHRWIRELVGRDESRGLDFTLALLQRAGSRQPWLVPRIIALLWAKWIGYRCGFNSHRLPPNFIRWASGQKYYWHSEYAHPNFQHKK
jgi:rhamnosyltransferase